MRTLTIILLIIFLTAVIPFSILIGKFLMGNITGKEDGQLIGDEEDLSQVETKKTDTDIEEEVEEIDLQSIQTVEVYLDGNRDNGIFLGEAKYGLTSKEAYAIYGEDFSESGYMLVLDNADYDFVPGSIHYIYIYTYIPEYGWEYTRERVVIEGETEQSENIKLFIDKPAPDEIVAGDDNVNVRIKGWSADFSVPDNTGIERIEVYLNGPGEFGKFLGEAEYGAERPDVVDVVGNDNYFNSGYNLIFNSSGLEPGSRNTFYVYSFSNSGSYISTTRDFIIAGEGIESHTVLSVEANLNNDFIEISGWAINENMVLEGKPPALDQEYTMKKIVFSSNRNGNDDIFSMNLDGSELAQLTDHPDNDKYPAISSDGKKIAFTSIIDGQWQIVTMNWDGTDRTQLTSTPVRNGFPGWSFDGRYIFYEVYQDDDWEIYRINTDGSNIKRITFNASANDWHPFAHPFKHKVIYESGVYGNEDIYIMDFDGDNIQKLSDTLMRKRVPAVSKDGAIIVFTSYEGDNYFLYTMDHNGENIIKIPNAPVNSGHPNISPDNEYVTFQVRTSNKGNINDVYIMNMDGSNLTRLTNLPGNDWDPIFLYQTPD